MYGAPGSLITPPRRRKSAERAKGGEQRRPSARISRSPRFRGYISSAGLVIRARSGGARARVLGAGRKRAGALRKTGNGVEVHSAAARHEYPRARGEEHVRAAVSFGPMPAHTMPLHGPTPAPSSGKDTSCSSIRPPGTPWPRPIMLSRAPHFFFFLSLHRSTYGTDTRCSSTSTRFLYPFEARATHLSGGDLRVA